MSYHQYNLYIDKTEDDYFICKWMESFNKPKKNKVLKTENLNEIIDNNKEEKRDSLLTFLRKNKKSQTN